MRTINHQQSKREILPYLKDQAEKNRRQLLNKANLH